MSVKAMAAVVAVGEGERLNVSGLCRAEGVTRKTFYKWVARYRLEGLDGLEERSRRPLSSPHRTGAGVEDMIVRLRKELSDAGLDHGATTIQWHLGRAGSPMKVPSVATVHRILVRRGLVVSDPGKRPKKSWRRFEAPAPNEWWQIDSTDWVTAAGRAKIFNVVDDHSRVAVRSRAVTEATTDEAWTTFSQAAQVWGLPAGVLSDNGLCFSGKLRGFEVFFEAKLRDAGVRPFTGRPYHPQTTGKVERFQQTLKKWLRRQPWLRTSPGSNPSSTSSATSTTMNDPIKGSTERPRSAAGGPPRQPAQPAHHWTIPDWPSARIDNVTVNSRGCVSLGRQYDIHIGVEYVNQAATIVADDRRANVFIDGQLIRHLLLDPTRRYQPSGRPRGGPARPRLTS